MSVVKLLKKSAGARLISGVHNRIVITQYSFINFWFTLHFLFDSFPSSTFHLIVCALIIHYSGFHWKSNAPLLPEHFYQKNNYIGLSYVAHSGWRRKHLISNKLSWTYEIVKIILLKEHTIPPSSRPEIAHSIPNISPQQTWIQIVGFSASNKWAGSEFNKWVGSYLSHLF